MKNLRYFIGVDVAKKTLAFCVYDSRESKNVLSEEIKNTPESIDELFARLGKLPEFGVETAGCCLENTGVYQQYLVANLATRKMQTAIVDGLEIKLSMGKQRGKSDPMDAQKIAQYAYLHRDQLRLHVAEPRGVEKLKSLTSLRDRLTAHKTGLEQTLNELKAFDLERYELLKKSCAGTLEALENDLKAIEKSMGELVSDDDELQATYKLMISVKGIGKVTAWLLLVYTRNFTRFDNAKQLACYAGVVPFPNESGGHKGRKRVSPLANKALKKVLHLAAMSAVRSNPALKAYYERKVAAGKNKMSALNAVRNKLILTVWSVVKNRRPWTENPPERVKKISHQPNLGGELTPTFVAAGFSVASQQCG